jgi:hypothetical protein
VSKPAVWPDEVSEVFLDRLARTYVGRRRTVTNNVWYIGPTAAMAPLTFALVRVRARIKGDTVTLDRMVMAQLVLLNGAARPKGRPWTPASVDALATDKAADVESVHAVDIDGRGWVFGDSYAIKQPHRVDLSFWRRVIGAPSEAPRAV